MSTPAEPVEITLRIPGNWAHPGELIDRLPEGCQLSPDSLVLPGGERIEFSPMQPDQQFARIFESSCRRPPKPDELERVRRYTVNVGLTGPGGSLEDVRTMMEAAAIMIRAGGAGVFIDNSGMAHGASQWLAMTEDGSSDAISYAFVCLFDGEAEISTMGMHVLGLPEIAMRREDTSPNGDPLVDALRYISRGDRPVDRGHILVLDTGETLHVASRTECQFPPGSPMHNPFGKLLLLPGKEIAERN
jgi:hypothetical protein